MIRIERSIIIKRLIQEQQKENPSDKVFLTIDKILNKLHSQENKTKRIIGYIDISNKDYFTLFQ